MRTSLFIILSAVFLIKIISDERKVSQQADQLTGAQLYAKYCLTCHQADGNGVRGQFPPLAGNGKVTGPASEVIRIVLFGLEGPITVNEKDYNQLMPAQGYLKDDQIASILSYVRSNWGNKAQPVTPDDVSKTRKLGKVTN